MRGAVILVTNEPRYWQPRRTERRTNADEFRIHEGLELSGTRAWGPNTGGTMKKRESLIELLDDVGQLLKNRRTERYLPSIDL